MYIGRFLEKDIVRYLKKREVLAVIGPRQCGKTTLLKHIFSGLKNAAFLDFEDRETLELFDEDIKSFCDIYVKSNDYLFIDEFQYAKDGGRKLKYIYDTYRTKVIVSGSSVSALSVKNIQFMVGRIFVFNLYPFSFGEYLSHKEPKLYDIYAKNRLTRQIIERITPYFNEFCLYGGYPRVILADDKKEKDTVLRNIYNTYFLREVKEILNLPEDYKLSKLILALALQVGNLINYNELCGVTGFDNKELASNLNALEKTFICLRSPPFYTNKRTELVKAQKIFFMDNGFRNAVIKNFQQVRTRQDKGALYENFVASELHKSGIEVKYWRSKSKAEVDFVIDKAESPIPVEVKSDLKKPKLSKSFLSFTEKYNPKKCFVLSENLFKLKGKTRFIPIFSVRNVV